MDTHVERLVRDGSLHAWASLPAVAHVDGRNTSDSVRRYLRVEGQHARAFRADDASLLTCFDTPCQITVAVESEVFLQTPKWAAGRRPFGGRASRGRGARRERASCKDCLNPSCGRMRATEHASRGPFHVLERRHGLHGDLVRGAVSL